MSLRPQAGAVMVPRRFVAQEKFDVVPPGDDPVARTILRGEEFEYEVSGGFPTIIHKGKRVRLRSAPIRSLVLKGWVRELPESAETVLDILDLCAKH